MRHTVDLSFLVQQFSVVARLEQNGSSLFNKINKKRTTASKFFFYLLFFCSFSFPLPFFFFAQMAYAVATLNTHIAYPGKEREKGKHAHLSHGFSSCWPFPFLSLFLFALLLFLRLKWWKMKGWQKKCFLTGHYTFFFFFFAVCLFVRFYCVRSYLSFLLPLFKGNSSLLLFFLFFFLPVCAVICDVRCGVRLSFSYNIFVSVFLFLILALLSFFFF